ncbi:hypothetical protein [Polyangium mundeleinium]|uniref:DUF3310 domain-containing protein n=1 Tax=Polyangium mundeleinium TaxID=2995306 RepID=A0ABT5EY20_9BACT|nr:hypothetical protein [Polyangium mundeleinium]MDC0740140.1 hypothetical protein [Polyangium mundeleinium]MDC0746686.1 hypothetical protein [Polyangium mundeleinium]
MPPPPPKATIARAAPKPSAPGAGKVSKRAMVLAAGRKVAAGGKTAGRAIVRGAVVGGRALATAGKATTRVIYRQVRENWKTVLLNEGLGFGAHTATFFADRAAYRSYLRDLEGNPILQWLAKPSNILVALEGLGLALTRGNVRKAIREALRGTLHAKVGENLHAWFGNGREAVPQMTTRGVEDVAGVDQGEPEPAPHDVSGVEPDAPDEPDELEGPPDEEGEPE